MCLSMLFNTAQPSKPENIMRILLNVLYLTLLMLFSFPAFSAIPATPTSANACYVISGAVPGTCTTRSLTDVSYTGRVSTGNATLYCPNTLCEKKGSWTKSNFATTYNYWFNGTFNYSCPANSTLDGSSCNCDSGYKEEGGSCVPDEDDCPEGQSKDFTGTCKPPKTDDDCKPAGKDQYYGTEINLPYAVVDLCFNGCQYRDALRDFVDGSCSDATNPFYSAFQPVPPSTTSPTCAHTHASAQGVYVYTVGTRTGSACTTNENGGNADDGTNEPPPPFNPDDPDGDGEENPNDGDPPECNAVSGECSDSETESSFTCNADGTISNFTCTGEASVCSTHQQSAETSCEELKESNCNPLIQVCTPKEGDGSFSDLDPDIQTAKQELQDYFDQVKNAIKSKFSFNTNVNGQLPCESVDLGVLGQFTLCVSDYADELEQVGQMILAIGFLLSIFIILG